MQRPIHNIINSAHSKGACQKLDKISDYRSLVWAFFSPQGIEFCEKHNYPGIETFRAIKDYVKNRGVYVDRGDVSLKGQRHICLVGNTHATIEAQGVKCVHTVILMHGATATIHASNYAVIKIVNISGGKVEVIKDKTVVEL